ncbi:MAG: hypothetical protein J6Y80_06330 [Victivallales bacterium]|nr:hypothetical protein [Victivallales bacterium]
MPAAEKDCHHSGAWRPLVDGRLTDVRRERYRRLLLAVVVILLLPVLCVLLVSPFFYRAATAAVPTASRFAESEIFSLPDSSQMHGDKTLATFYSWLALADPRQCLLPDSRAGFSRHLQFTPCYSAGPFPVYKSAESTGQPQYSELFSLIAPQYPRTIVNEEVNLLWQHPMPLTPMTGKLEVRPGAGRPVWHLSDGTVIEMDEEPALAPASLAHWQSGQTRAALAARLRESGAESTITRLEIQSLPSLKLPQLSEGEMKVDDSGIPVVRVVLRGSCGDSILDQAAGDAVRALVQRHSGKLGAQGAFTCQLWVDWTCW